MKKNTALVIILVIALIAISSGLTILAIKVDENSKVNKVEQVVMADRKTSNTNSKDTSDKSNVDADAENNDNHNSTSDVNRSGNNRTETDVESLDNQVTTTDNKASQHSPSKEGQQSSNITVEDGSDDSDCNISVEQAVGLGLKAIEKDTGIDCSDAKVRVNRYDTNENVTWNCVAEVGEHRFEFRVNANSGKILSSTQYDLEKGSNYVWILKSNQDIIEKKIDQQKIEAYKSLKIEADCNMNVEVQKGEYYSIKAKYYGNEEQVAYDIKDGTLQIEVEGFSESEGDEANTLTLTIPEDVTLEDVNVSLDYGNFTMEKVKANTIDASLEFGSLTMNEVASAQSTLEIGTGDAKLTDMIADTNSIDIDTGNVQMDNCTSKECTIHLDLGEAKLKGKLTGHTECTTALGSAKLHCTGAAKDYNYSLETDMGAVSVDGKTSTSKLSKDNAAANTINVRANMGEAELDFE